MTKIIRRHRNERRLRNVQLIRRELRNSSNPLEILPDTEFKQEFRLTKSICRIFMDLILPHMEERRIVSGLTKEQRLFCALRFFAVGETSFFCQALSKY